jgi:uncharacterized membrane protein
MKKITNTYQPTTYSVRRTEAISDGVFAIAMTLLVLELSVPLSSHIINNQQLLNELGTIFPSIISFVISFLVLSLLWGVHARQFEYVQMIDRRVMFINNLRLMFVVLVPFAASVTSDYYTIPVAQLMLPIVFFVVTCISIYQWYYLTKNNYAIVKKQQHEDLQDRNNVSLLLSFIIIPVAYFIGQPAFFVFVLMSPALHYLKRRRT